jgi:hypothetical protein
MGLTGYLLAGGAAACLALTGALWLALARIDTLNDRNAALTLQLNSCAARTTNMIEDKESDNAIDTIPDANLDRVPDSWLRQPGAGSVY